MTWIVWVLALYGFYKFVKWVRRKNLQRAYTNYFLRELEKEIRANPVYFEKNFGVKIPNG